MSDTKNLKVALKIEADLNAARQEVAAFKQDLNGLGSAANALGKNLNNSAIDKISDDLQYAQQQVQAVAAAFKYAGESSFSLKTLLGATSQSAAKISDDLTKVEKTSQAAGAAFVYAGKSNFSFRTILGATSKSVAVQADEVTRLLKTYDAADYATNELTKDQAMLRRAFEQGAISQQQYERAAISLTRRQQMLSSSYASLRGSMANFGFQLQDIAVQMQMGVNPFVIWSQQGSQLVSSFNPLAGAIIAISGAVVGALIPAFFDAGKATDELSDKITKLHEDYTGLTDAQRQFLVDQENKNKDKIIADIKSERAEIEKLTVRYNEMVAAKNNASAPVAVVSTAGIGGGPGRGFIQGADEKAARNLTEARAKLDTKTEELAESEKQLRRINGEKVDDEKEQLKQAKQLVEKLKEETETYKLSGEELGVYVADKLKLKDGLRAEVIELYKKQDAQKKATEAERDAAAEEKSRARQAEATAKNNETYVKGLEAQAAALTQAAAVTAEAEFAERRLKGEQLERARAARQLLDADKERQKVVKENQQLAQLELQLLRAQGDTSKAAIEEIRVRYQSMLEGMSGDAKIKGQEIVDKLINTESLNVKMDEAQAAVGKALDDMARQEDSINVQREAGLISEYDARSKIVDLHKQTYELLEKQRPVLEELSKQPGAVGEEASKALAELDSQAQRLQATTGLLQTTLKRGLEGGLENAILGLADGTKSFGDAVRGLGQSVAQALAQMAAQAIASNIVGGLFGSGGGGGFLSAASTFFGFAEGGYTGPGAKYSVAGVVHKGEGVLSQSDIAALGGPSGFYALRESLRNGFADGGLAGVPAPAMQSPQMPSGLLNPAADPGTGGASLTNRIINVIDPELIDDHLSGPAGHKFIVNWMKRNTTLVQRFAGVKN